MDQYVGEHFDKVSNLAGSLQTKRMEGFKAMHATAMDPEVNPLDGSLLPLSPPLAYIQKKILPRIFRNPLARPFLRPVDAVKEGIFPDYYQVVTRPMCLGTVERRLAAGWYWDANHCHRDIQQVWTNAKLYNPANHPIHEWAATLEMLVWTWSRRVPREVGRDSRRGIEERNLRACTNIVAEIRQRQPVVLADQLGLQELERHLELGEFQSAEQLAGKFRLRVGRAYREGKLGCNLISEAHHSFEVEFANRVHAWEEEVEEDDVPEEEEVEEMEEDVLEEDELEHQRLLSLLSMSRRIERELGSLRIERKRWNHSVSEEKRWNHSEEKIWNHSEEEADEGEFSDESMEEEGMMYENYSRGSSSNHFVKSFGNIETYSNQLHAEL